MHTTESIEFDSRGISSALSVINSKLTSKPMVMKHKRFSIAFKTRNFEESLWTLYSYDQKKKEEAGVERGNFVRRVLSQELNQRQIEKKIMETNKKLDRILSVLQQFHYLQQQSVFLIVNN